MRVVHVTECFAGGVSRAIYTAVRLAPQHEHHLVYSGTDVPTRGTFSSVEQLPSSFLGRVNSVHSRVHDLAPDVVHAHSSWAGVYARARKPEAPVVYQPHCYKFDDPDAHPLLRRFYRFAEKRLTGRTAAVAVLTPHEQRLAEGLSRTTPTRVVPNVPSIRPDDDALVPPGPRVVMIGRLSRQKDPRHFLEVSRRTRARIDAEFVWIGDGDESVRRELESEGVQVTGWLDRAELHAQLRVPGVYYHSARYEGFPLSILDAAAFGLPIVARRIDALEGFAISQVDDADEATERIVELLENRDEAVAHADDERRRLLAVMTDDRQADALDALYKEVSRG